MPTPLVPEGVWLQVALLESRVVYRIADDGRYLLTLPTGVESEQQPRSKREAGIQRVSAAGQARLRTAVDLSGFASLAAEIEGRPIRGTLVNGEDPHPQPVAFSVRSGDEVHTVTVVGDPASPVSLGALGPLWTALDLEAVGGWLGE